MSYWIDENGEIHRGGDGGQTPPPPPPPPNGGFDLGVAVSIISLIASNIFLLIYIIGLMSGWDRDMGTFLKWASCICIGLYLLGRLLGWIDKDDMPLFFKLFAGIISVIIFCGSPDMFGWWDVGEVFSWAIRILGASLLVEAFVKD